MLKGKSLTFLIVYDCVGFIGFHFLWQLCIVFILCNALCVQEAKDKRSTLSIFSYTSSQDYLDHQMAD